MKKKNKSIEILYL